MTVRVTLTVPVQPLMTKNSKETRGISAVRNRLITRIRRRLSFLTAPLLIWVLFALCLIYSFPYSGAISKFDLPKEGTASKETIIAPFTFDVKRLPEELESERRRVTSDVPHIMDYDSAAVVQTFRLLTEIRMAVINAAIADIEEDSLKAAAAMQILSRRRVPPRTADVFRRRRVLFDVTERQATALMERGVSASPLDPSVKRVTIRRGGVESSPVDVSDIPAKEAALEQTIGRLRREQGLDDEAINAVYALLDVCVQPNLKVDAKTTAERRQAAADGVLTVIDKVVEGTAIVRKHEEVTSDIVRRLHSLRVAVERMEGEVDKDRASAGVAARIALILIPLVFLSLYLRKYKPSLVKSSKSMFALSIIVLMQIAAIRFGLEYFPPLFETRDIALAVPEFLIPITMAALQCTILFGFQVSTLVSLFVSIYFGVVVGFDQFIFLYAFLNGVATAFLNYRIRYRWHFFKAIPPMAVMSTVVIAIWHVMGWRFDGLYVNIICAFVGILASVFITMALTPIFERLFDITTDMTLIELSDMNHPILKRLSIEASGTYNHSVLVGNLAESAAQAIGANALLARVASYYHDIGKIDKPDYFVENCLGDSNRHNKLSPSMSALIICSHVKEGVDLARKHRLPKTIQDVILQHHGDSQVSFFYEKALEQDPHKQVQEKDFRYPGPTPQTREAGIIMLADSVEAAARCLATSQPKLLRELVKKIIRDKFLSGQLDQCNLTLRDLSDITEGFMPILQGIFHSRIDYPSK